MNNNTNNLIVDLGYWLNERGWSISSTSEYSPGRLEVRLKPTPSPPPLGVHVIDGVAGKDKVGG